MAQGKWNATRRSRTIIIKLERFDGSIISDGEQIELHLVEFFQKLYSKNEGGRGEQKEWNGAPLTVSMTELEEPFSEEEIKRAVFESDGSKAPGPDGFTMAVYQQCWDTIKWDLTKVFNEFFEGKIF